MFILVVIFSKDQHYAVYNYIPVCYLTVKFLLCVNH